MSKAILVSADMNASFGTQDIYTMDFTPVETIRTGVTYTYTLKYISAEPLNMNDFPPEINTEKDTSDVKEVKPEIKQEPEPRRPISAIGQLEVSETVS